MTLRPAYDEIVLEHGSNAVILRPSLRAASTLERSVGFERLSRLIAEFHTGTVREIILTAATDRRDAARFLDAISRLPICRFVVIVQAQLFHLVGGFAPQPAPDAKSSQGKMVPLRELYRDMYRRATGWLHWTPDATWSATPTEITEALSGHFDMLRAIHGSAEEQPDQPEAYSPERLREIDELGFDPEFDRAGLQALKAKYGRKPR